VAFLNIAFGLVILVLILARHWIRALITLTIRVPTHLEPSSPESLSGLRLARRHASAHRRKNA
jgi:hypothetical protein